MIENNNCNFEFIVKQMWEKNNALLFFHHQLIFFPEIVKSKKRPDGFLDIHFSLLST